MKVTQRDVDSGQTLTLDVPDSYLELPLPTDGQKRCDALAAGFRRLKQEREAAGTLRCECSRCEQWRAENAFYRQRDADNHTTPT